MPRACSLLRLLQGDIIAASYSPFPFLSNSSAVAVKKTSPLLLRAVSTESWTTPMMKPTASTMTWHSASRSIAKKCKKNHFFTQNLLISIFFCTFAAEKG